MKPGKPQHELSKVTLDSNAGYSISHVVDDPQRIRVLASHGGKIVGSVHLDRIEPGATHISAFQTQVEPEHQRKGVASAMYAHAEKVTGLPMKPSSMQSSGGRGLWEGNKRYPQFGKSQREKEPTRVASVACFNPDGLLLFGVRNDTGKYTLPGGHFEPGEEPLEAARRELEEETGLKGENFEYLGVGEVRAGLHVHCYRCLVIGEPDGGQDPDEECSEWKWVEANDVPDEIMDNLHSKNNVTLRLLGIQDGEVEEPLEKKDIEASAPIPVQHYGTTPGLKALDPSFMGTGSAGQERNRSGKIPRTYYYTRPGTPEAHVAAAPSHLYHGELPAGTKLYDMGEDRLGLKKDRWKPTKMGMVFQPADMDAAERKLKKLGYHGYHNYGTQDALAYFHPLPVQPIAQGPNANFEDEDGWTQAKYRRGGEEEFENWIPDEKDLEKSEEEDVTLLKAFEYLKENPYKELRKPTKVGVAYRAYKNSPHHPISLFLKYAVHRAENEDFYKKSTPEEIDRHEADWLVHHQQGKAAEKNGHVTVEDLRETLAANPNFIPGLKREQKKLHKFIQNHSPHRIVDINGEPHLPLARGYKVKDIGADHELASYADDTGTAGQFGGNLKHWHVPMKNIWYSYEAGPRSFSSDDYGGEDEFLVSNHPRREAPPEDVKQVVPKALHSYRMPVPTWINWQLVSHHPSVTAKMIDEELQSGSPQRAGQAIKHPNATKEQIDHVLKSGNRFPPQVQLAVFENPNATPEQIDDALDYGAPDVKGMAIRHPNATAENVSRALDQNITYLSRIALEHPSAREEHIERAMNHESPHVRRQAAMHPNATPEQIDRALTDKEMNVREGAMLNPSAGPSHIHKVLTAPLGHGWHQKLATEHPNASIENLELAMQHSSSFVSGAAIRHSKATPEMLLAALKSGDSLKAQAALTHEDLTPEHIDAAFGNKDEEVRWRAVQHPAATAAHVDYATSDIHPTVRSVALQNPKSSMHHLTRGLNDDTNFVQSTARTELAKRRKATEAKPFGVVGYEEHVAKKNGWRRGEGLQKGLPGLALAGALALGTGGARQAPAAPQASVQAAQPPAWSNVGLHPDLEPIAHLESSYGQNMAHASNSKGDFHTAFGALGFKPVTAHEEYTKSKYMNQQYPGLSAPETFLKAFKTDPKFYNLLASAHFSRLKARHGGPQQAAYAWRYGTGATANATPEQIDNDAYVQRYTHMNLHAKQGQPTIQKSESLVDRIKPHLTDDIRRAPWRGNSNCLAGHCYVASEALYHLLGGKESGYVPQNIQHEGAPHWYLKHGKTGEILDPTAGQFQVPVPYEKGVGKGFLTKQPSKRAQLVIDAVHGRRLKKDELEEQENRINENIRRTDEERHMARWAAVRDDVNRAKDFLRSMDYVTLPSKLLLEAYGSENTSLQASAVGNSGFPPEKLKEVFNNQSPGFDLVAWAAVNNRKFPEKDLPLAMKHPDEDVRRAALKNPIFPSWALPDVLNDKSPDVVVQAASDKRFPVEAMSKALEHPNKYAARGLLANPRFPAELSSKAFQHTDEAVRKLVVNRADAPKTVLIAAANDRSEWVREAISDRMDMPRELYPILSKDPYEGVRRNIIRRVDCPSDILQSVLEDPKEIGSLKSLAVSHNNFPVSGYASALQSDISDVRHWAIIKDNIPANLLAESLRNDPNPFNQAAAVRNSNFPSDILPEAYKKPDFNVRKAVIQHEMCPPEILTQAASTDEHLTIRGWAVKHKDFPPEMLHEAFKANPDNEILHEYIARRKDATPEVLLDIAKRRYHDDGVPPAKVAIRNRNFPPEGLAEVFRDKNAGRTLKRIVIRHKNCPPELFSELVDSADENDELVLDDALERTDFPPALLPKLLNHPNEGIARAAKELHQRAFPDSYHNEAVDVRFGTNKLRQLRDTVEAAGGKVHRKDVPNLPPVLTKLLDGRGYLASSAIQSAIDAMPATKHNVSHTTWFGVQRHNKEESKVLQLNLTNDHLNKMKEAGVLPTFHAINDLSRSSGHPVTPSTWGWVRYTGGDDGVHIDEVQSDLGQSLVQRAAAEAAQAGIDPDEAASRAENKYPDQHLKKIQEILFSGKHPSEVLQEAFHQHLRDNGGAGIPIAIHAAATKAPLSGMDTDKPLPGHMLTGYKAVPEKMGLKPSTYGKLATQSNPDLKDKPTYEDEIRKAEPEPGTYHVLQHLGMVETPPEPLNPLHDRRAANTDPDPLEAMLQHENPRERILALKNKHTSPYHLRIALRDEDPEVRAFAARHPRMTEPMIHEALQHEDLHTRKAALSRPDLTPEHIQSVLFDPDLQTLAARHPKATEEQREMVAEHHQTPEGLKQELLAKNVGYLMYPRLGQNSVPSTPMIRDPESHATAAVAGGGDLKTAMSRGFTRYNAGARGGVKPSSRHFSLGVKTGPGLMGSLGHETQHGIFAHLKQNYGKEAAHRIVATTLTALDPREHQHLKNLTDWAVSGYDPLKHPEERIAHLQNYLQDPMWRAKAHRHMKILGHRDAEKASHDVAKQIWQKLRIRAKALTPQEVGVILKTEADVLQDWVELKKNDVQVAQFVKAEPDLSHNVFEDQLGMRPQQDAALKAAKFLARVEPDADLFRQHLLAGLTVDDAALLAAGMDATGANRRALLAVLDLQDGKLAKSEPGEKFEVQALMPDGTSVAEAIQRGFDAETHQDLHLGGRHSKGTMMVRDPDSGLMFILKPGSGKQSPALGAREEGASQSRREACFWHMADVWGLGNRIPRADLMLINGQEVAALHLLPFDWKSLEKLKYDDPALPHKALEKYRSTGELHKWVVLDLILGNADRHGQNLMVGPQDDGYPVALIDHGSAFAGPSFDPARDKNSFIPYYLRAWSGDSWKDLTPEQKLRAMPTIPRDTDAQLKMWLEGLHAGELEQVLARYGIDPAPSMARLTRVKLLLSQDSLSAALNRMWLI